MSIINAFLRILRDLFLKNSWFVGVIGVIFAGVGGVITNATSGPVFSKVCGEGNFCTTGVFEFMFYRIEGWMISVGILASSFSAYIGYKDKDEIEKLSRELEIKSEEISQLNEFNTEITSDLSLKTVNTFEVFSLILKTLAAELGLKEEDRISIYKVSEDHFFLIGRYSTNQSYRRIGRNYYPRQEGILEKAFERSWFQADLGVSYADNNARRKKYADEQLRKFRIPVQTANRFNMKSRCYRALSIKDGGLGEPDAIVCIESTGIKSLNHLNREMMEARFSPFAIFLLALEHHVPSMDNAMRQGL